MNKKYKFIIILFVLDIILYYIFSRFFNLNKITIENGFYSNILNVVSIFCGFLFTNLSILISLTSANLLKHKDKINTTYITSRNDYIFTAIVYGLIIICLSIVASVINSIFNIKCFNYNISLIFFIFEVELTLCMLYYFFMSVYYMYKLIDTITNLEYGLTKSDKVTYNKGKEKREDYKKKIADEGKDDD